MTQTGYTATFPVDLHTHTTRSDGNDTPAELIENAARCGLKVVALTDHDVLPPEAVETDGASVPLAEYAARRGIAALPGIEVSCDTFVDDVHIVGLGCDWASPELRWLPALAVASKVESYRLLVGKLAAAGMSKLSWEELLLNGRRKPEAVQKKHLFELIAWHGYAPTWQEAKILVRDNPAYDVKREKPDPVKTIASLHAAGGIAILAHPYLIDETVVLEGAEVARAAYIERLLEAGLDGIEARYTYDKTSYKGALPPQAICEEVTARYGGRVAVISGGSDYHADHKKGATNPRRLGESGLTMDEFRSQPLLDRLCQGGRKSELLV
jgi:predicted metal-dependent phosphoesterase TrpH